jgi:hypothetical protein
MRILAKSRATLGDKTGVNLGSRLAQIGTLHAPTRSKPRNTGRDPRVKYSWVTSSQGTNLENLPSLKSFLIIENIEAIELSALNLFPTKGIVVFS